MVKRGNMRIQQAPKSKKSDIWKKSQKDLVVYRGHMNINNRRYSVSTNVDRYVKSRQVNVRPVKMLVKSASKLDHQLASSLGDINKSTMSMKDSFISPESPKNPTILSSNDDLNEVGFPKKSQALNVKGGVVQRSNGVENSVHTPLKATTMLVLKDTCSSSMNMGQSKLSQEDAAIGKSGSYEKLELAESYKKVGNVKVISPNLTSSLLDGNQYPHMFGTCLSNCQQGKASCMADNNSAILPYEAHSELCSRRHLGDSIGHTNSGKSKRWSGSLMEGKPETNDDIHHIDGVVQLDNQICRPLKKIRHLLVAIEDEDEYEDEDEKIENRCCDLNHMSVEDDTTRSTHETTISKDDSQAKVHVTSCVQEHSYCCSKPIDEPIWSGIFKINGKEYMSLAGHLSTKSGKKAWQFSKSLTPIIHVTKISRSNIWPKGWETSKADDNNIGLYFLPQKTSVDKELDRLVKELIENDLALRAVINEVEILIFTSTLLPQRYQTFHTKHYLWGVFMHKKEKGIVVEDALTTAVCCAKVVEKEAQQAPKILDGIQWEELGREMILSNNYMALEKQRCPNKSTPDVKAIGAQGLQSMDFESRATQEGRQGDTLFPTMHPAEANTIGTSGTSTISTSMLYGFVVPQTPRFEQLIREMEREGAVVWKGIQ